MPDWTEVQTTSAVDGKQSYIQNNTTHSYVSRLQQFNGQFKNSLAENDENYKLEFVVWDLFYLTGDSDYYSYIFRNIFVFPWTITSPSKQETGFITHTLAQAMGTNRGMIAYFLLLWILGCVHGANMYPEFDARFLDFLRENGYRGGAVAAMKDGRLLLARGYGHDRAGHKVSAYSKFPVSSIAKSMTAVAILHLVKKGMLKLDQNVFGSDGILHYIEPWKTGDVDPRLHDITVDHLLRHSVGWNTTKGPLYDPLFNTVYQERGYKVPNIAKELGKELPLQYIAPEELISYVTSFPLDFTPGTEVIYSNVGYLVLGRVIEALTETEYRDYIKRLILDRCGMWNTRLERAHYVEEELLNPADHDPSVLNYLDPVAIDSALGWYSNVYDLMRFSRCLFHSKALLDDEHLEMLKSKLPSAPVQHSDSWYGAGFRVSTKGAVWQDADLHTDDLILYHQHANTKGEENLKLDVILETGKTHSSYSSDLPDSWVILLCDKNLKHLRHKSRDFMTVIQPSSHVANSQNIFLFDLSEMHRHPTWEPPKSLSMPEFTLRYKVDEHHLTAYINALKAEGFSLRSFTSHTHRQHTFFLIVGKREISSSNSDSDYIFVHGMDHRQLKKTKLRLEKLHYNMTLLHSYKSMSHMHQYAFAALFNHEAFSIDMQMKYGTNHLPEPYEKLVQMYYEQEFYPLSQTIVFHGKDERFSFIFVRKFTDTRVNFRQYYNLSVKRLSKVTAENARKNLHLSYMNTYSTADKSRFSAIFTNATHYRGLLEVDQPPHRATEITILNLHDGLVPKQVVPYFNDNNHLRIAAYYEEV